MKEPEIRAAIAALQALLPSGSPPRPKVADVMSLYMASVEFQNLRSRATEEGRIRLHILRLLGDDEAESLTRTRAKWYRDQRREETNIGRATKTSSATRNREVIRLSAALGWAAKEGLIAQNPIYGAPMEAEDNVRATCPEASDVNRILVACWNRRLKAMIATAFWSGIRRGELVALRLDQIEWDEGLIVIHARQAKTRRPRVTILPDRASRAVRDYLDSRAREGIVSPYVFCTASGKKVSGRNFLRDFQRAGEVAGFTPAEGERLVAHDLRSGFIGHQLELGTPERTIMDMSGHSTHEAFDRYVRVKKKWLLDVRERTELQAARHAALRSPNCAGKDRREENVSIAMKTC